MTGAGRLAAGVGIYIDNLGRYQINHEVARRLYIDNRSHYIRERWRIKDEYKERFRRDHPTYAERLENRMDMAEKMHALRQREKELIEKGILPEPGKPAFIYKGESYPSYEAFKQTAAYQDMMAEVAAKRKERELEKIRQEERRQQAVEFERRRRYGRPLKEILGEELYNDIYGDKN